MKRRDAIIGSILAAAVMLAARIFDWPIDPPKLRRGDISYTPNGTKIVWLDRPHRIPARPEAGSGITATIIGPCWITPETASALRIEI